jgi:CheY-like chemotaxis protein
VIEAGLVSRNCDLALALVGFKTPRPSGATMPTILLVDDDDAVRRAIEDHLASSGYDVLIALDTVVALDQLTSHPQVDLCLIDLVMPSDVPDGLAFGQSVREERPDMPVILMTGYFSAGARVTDPVSSVIYKPVDLDKLVAEIKRLLTP